MFAVDVSPLQESAAIAAGGTIEGLPAAQILEPIYRVSGDWTRQIGVYEILARHALDPDALVRAVASGRQTGQQPRWRRVELRYVDLKAGRHLLNLINEVLDLSRIEANQQQLSLEPVRAQSVVEEALSLIRPLAVQRGVPEHRREVDRVVDERRVQQSRRAPLPLLASALGHRGS